MPSPDQAIKMFNLCVDELANTAHHLAYGSLICTSKINSKNDLTWCIHISGGASTRADRSDNARHNVYE